MVTMTASAGGPPQTVDVLDVLDGTLVYTVFALGQGVAPPATPSLPALAAKLISRVAALGG